jgi:hypothetical protein
MRLSIVIHYPPKSPKFNQKLKEPVNSAGIIQVQEKVTVRVGALIVKMSPLEFLAILPLQTSCQSNYRRQ